jgi:hypothetical protein
LPFVIKGATFPGPRPVSSARAVFGVRPAIFAADLACSRRPRFPIRAALTMALLRSARCRVVERDATCDTEWQRGHLCSHGIRHPRDRLLSLYRHLAMKTGDHDHADNSTKAPAAQGPHLLVRLLLPTRPIVVSTCDLWQKHTRACTERADQMPYSKSAAIQYTGWQANMSAHLRRKGSWDRLLVLRWWHNHALHICLQPCPEVIESHTLLFQRGLQLGVKVPRFMVDSHVLW